MKNPLDIFSRRSNYETQTLGIIKTKKYYKQLLGVLRSSAHTCDLSAQLKMKKQTPTVDTSPKWDKLLVE